MPAKPVIHPDAKLEFDDIDTRGTVTERVVSTAAWADALLSSMSGSVAALRRGAVFLKGPVYVAEHSLLSPKGSTVRGTAVVGVNSTNAEVEVLACDVSGSPWWHGTSPELRAGSRMR